MQQTPLERAVKVTGSQSALARAIGVAQGHVWYWLNKAKQVPAEHVLDIEAATDGAVSRHDLRPDIYPFDTTPGGPGPGPDAVPPDKRPEEAA